MAKPKWPTAAKTNYAARLFKRLLRKIKLFSADVSCDRVLDFGPEPAFGRYNQFFPEEAIAHPAKANLEMVEWIILRYTKPGDLILDPMAGTYSTCIVAAINNRNAIGVELEEKFYKWGLEAKHRIETIPTLMPKGKIVVLKGDARELSKVLAENASAIIFSPPFTNEPFTDKKFMRGEEQTGRCRARFVDFGPGDIGGLPYGTLPNGGGSADAVVFSPPYAEANRGGGIAVRGYDKGDKHDDLHLRHDRPLSDSPDNLSNLDYGSIDAMEECRHPPDQLHEAKKWFTQYGKTQGQLGNLKGKTYLSAMFKVYSECFKVLRPGGVMVLITKNFVRQKKVVRLDLDTIKLCEKAGFKFIERWYRKLEQPSFWRIIYAKKFNYCPRCTAVYRVRNATSDKPFLTTCPKDGVKLLPALIRFEDILVFRKPAKSEMCPMCGKHELVPNPSDTLLCPECGFTKVGVLGDEE